MSSWAFLIFCITFTGLNFSVIAAQYPEVARRVVIDPGHGGRYISPNLDYGDKFDIVTKTYLDRFSPGAHYQGIWESEETYELAVQVEKRINWTITDPNRFSELIEKFAKKPNQIKPIISYLSRPPSYANQYFKIDENLNHPYRLYDYPGQNGNIRHGRISRINHLRPHLVVNLHLTSGNSPPTGGMAAVISPSYQTFAQARKYVQANSRRRQKIRKQFYKSKWKNWFLFAKGYDPFGSFMCDAWIYFTGRWSTRSGLSPLKKKYRGYRQNMISWTYRDKDGWEKLARKNKKKTPYARNLRDFSASGKFWQREKGRYEKYRRENGPEGFGGDNFYSAQELFRFSRMALLNSEVDQEETLPEIMPPYISAWTLPIYTNAINAYLEIGHLSNPYDRKRILKHKDVYADAIAAGIYSLIYSLDIKSSPVAARGKSIEWEKYFKKDNYFEKVHLPAKPLPAKKEKKRRKKSSPKRKK